MDTSTEHFSPLNDTSENQVLSDNQIIYFSLRTVPASVGGLSVFIGVALLVIGAVVYWSRKCKQRTSTNHTAPNNNRARDIDQRYCNTQRSPSDTATTINGFDIKHNIAYHAYDFSEHVYAQPHIMHSSTQDDYI